MMDRLQEDTGAEEIVDFDDIQRGQRQTGWPRLRIEEFFLGDVRGHGLFQDRFGNLRQEFTVDMSGRWLDGIFHLDERFRFRDGKRSRRQWNVQVIGDRQYEATADDIIGVAKGQQLGSTVQWRYTLAVPVGRRIVNMSFDDRMFLQEDGVMINVSDARKWGIRLGRLTASFGPRT